MLGWAWLVPPFRRMSDALARTDVTAVALDAPQVRELCNAHPEMVTAVENYSERDRLAVADYVSRLRWPERATSNSD